MPPITFGNCNHIHPNIDELGTNCRFIYQYRETCCLAFTETYQHGKIPKAAIAPSNLTTVRADRDIASSGKSNGGGLALFINNKWCNNISVKSQICQPDFDS